MAQVVPLQAGRVPDVAIVGAGLCGLALARLLATRGLDVQVIEARQRTRAEAVKAFSALARVRA